jgi:hypothetical protein
VIVVVQQHMAAAFSGLGYSEADEYVGGDVGEGGRHTVTDMSVERRGRARWIRRGVVGVVGVVVVVVAAMAAVRQVRGLWYGEPYPVTDPRVAAQQLRDASQTVYTELDLTRPIEPGAGPNLCYERGWRSMNKQLEPDVYGVSLSWWVEMRADAVPDAIRLGRDALLAQGWRVTTDDGTYVRLERDARTLTLYRAVEGGQDGRPTVTSLGVDATAPCARIPDGYTGPLPDNAFAPWDLGLAPLDA